MVWVKNGERWKTSIRETFVRAFPVLSAQYISGHGRTEEDPLELGDLPLSLHTFEESAYSFVMLQAVYKEENRREVIHVLFGGYDDPMMKKQIDLLKCLGLDDIAILVEQEMLSQQLGLHRDKDKWSFSGTRKRLNLKREARMKEREIGVSEQDNEGRDIMEEGSSEVTNVEDKCLKKKAKRERQKAKRKLLTAIQRLGRYIRVYKTSADASSDLSDKTLKTQKLREEEQAAHRSMYTKSTIKVRFPDNFTLEATFHPSDTIQSLIDLLKQVVSEPERPFYIYTTTPEMQLIDMSQDFYSAGFIPGAIVYFSYDVPKGEDSSLITGPFLNEEILSFKDVVLTSEEELAVATKEPPYSATSPPSVHK